MKKSTARPEPGRFNGDPKVLTGGQGILIGGTGATLKLGPQMAKSKARPSHRRTPRRISRPRI